MERKRVLGLKELFPKVRVVCRSGGFLLRSGRLRWERHRRRRRRALDVEQMCDGNHLLLPPPPLRNLLAHQAIHWPFVIVSHTLLLHEGWGQERLRRVCDGRRRRVIPAAAVVIREVLQRRWRERREVVHNKRPLLRNGG